jgi:uncharacterized protein (DUF2336 family)
MQYAQLAAQLRVTNPQLSRQIFFGFMGSVQLCVLDSSFGPRRCSPETIYGTTPSSVDCPLEVATSSKRIRDWFRHDLSEVLSCFQWLLQCEASLWLSTAAGMELRSVHQGTGPEHPLN